MKINQTDGVGILTDMMRDLFLDIDDKQEMVEQKEDIIFNNYPTELQPFIKLVYSREGISVKFDSISDRGIKLNQTLCEDSDSDKRVLVAFSGGKDSLAVTIKLMDMGYKPILFHCVGINRSYPMEKEIAQSIADKLNLKMVVWDKFKYSGKQHFKENPIKNMLIQSIMIDYAKECGINKFCFGSASHSNMDNCNFINSWSDTQELIQEFNSFCKLVYSDFQYFQILDGDFDSFKTIINSDHPELVEEIISCILPHMYQKKIQAKNFEKYGVKPIGNRCGSCYKCSLDYIYMIACGYIKNIDKEFLKHLIRYLRDKAGYVLGEEHSLPKNATVSQILREWDLPLEAMQEYKRSLSK